MIMEAVGNIVDELMSAKKQALAAAFASMWFVSALPFDSFIPIHGYCASFELISDRAW
ncbi:hypothetical protein LBUL_1041 [Lactobacillus delbrueckii subsp. bulgaricus ATCC BAA-365]|nr:hypothetical protein LBUL_0967 [Lactobacillus delbrueckii subsp. bulgaricus ATCC BAA-365]ABJ58590.1 hypothetical protein LBUL_1041 [Lactobacillus delbrueckii subsp. bulgaricus ATCC BAA-365]